MARPRKEIDKKTFEKLCGLQCTLEETCDFLEVTDKTLRAWCRRTYRGSFSEVYKMYSAKGKIALRRAQLQAAEKGNASLLIWLGRNWLGQAEAPAQRYAGEAAPDDGLSASLREVAEEIEAERERNPQTDSEAGRESGSAERENGNDQ